ncbi:beta-ketoacyl-ACP synthase II [Cytobacillus kochii]|uniref:3-oxoacyl-[acyl-carrier-protein] synthase 2 n=1 Tax=Cytobacillus kochii TaxID=859143 RepID=A0A248TIA2_9BACI|nr:beta-ketoacyl-ACP synthase II [Cytobacillus kochii]ASV67938.1 beta-ketoacyl-[acyl-carrier-protein] synthase II [Cytobacillus kochii]
MKQKAVVTGMGVVTPIGIGVEQFWANLIRGKSGVEPISNFDTEHFTTKFAAQIKDYQAEDYFNSKEIKRMDAYTQYALIATKEALKQSRLPLQNIDPYRIGVIVGSGSGGLKTVLENDKRLIERGAKRVSPYLVSSMVVDAASSEITLLTGAKGKSGAFVTACATGTNCIGEGLRAIQWGEADVMIVGGAEGDLTPLDLAGFSNIKALSTRNDDPQGASRPFDKDRDGFVLGSGGGVLILESEDFARNRGATILAEIAGYGSTSDAYHQTAPDPNAEGMMMSMKKAIEDAGVELSEIDYINAHGTSTKYNDYYETMAIKKLWGEAATNIPISATKSMTGHLLGGAGAVELVASICSIRENLIHPTINCDHIDPELNLNFVPHEALAKQVKVALSNSFGFGGHNASIVAKEWNE